MSGDFCYHCDGTGERDWLSGAPCYECGGTGWREERDDTEFNYGSCDRCGCDLDENGADQMLCEQCLWWVEQCQ